MVTSPGGVSNHDELAAIHNGREPGLDNLDPSSVFLPCFSKSLRRFPGNVAGKESDSWQPAPPFGSGTIGRGAAGIPGDRLALFESSRKPNPRLSDAIREA